MPCRSSVRTRRAGSARRSETTSGVGGNGADDRLRIAILTRHDDFHAYVFRHVLASRGVDCSIILTDSLASVGGMSWSPSAEGAATISDFEGQEIPVSELHAIWWRRITGEPQLPESLKDEGARDLVISDCRATLLGILLTEFRGHWISHPEITRLAQNKLLQLRLARQVGLRVPRTLVSQDPERVRRFCEQLDYQVIVKPVQGTPRTPIMTGRVTPELVTADEAVRLSPAIYQELVPGTRHLRICCFGHRVYSALLETNQLDWRYPLDADVRPYRLDATVAGRLRRLIRTLGLRMGIVDMKLAPDGEPVWLEVNPQGQFLFLEGLCTDLPLTRHFADFLEGEARRALVGHRLARTRVPAPSGLGFEVAVS